MAINKRLLQKAAELERRGADPRRADPRFSRRIGLTLMQVGCLLAAAFGFGVLVSASFCGVVMLSFGSHLATSDDVRLAAVIRAARPDAETLSQDDLATCAALPIDLARSLAPLAQSDPGRTTIRTGWLDRFVDAPVHLISEDRIAALGRLLTRLATLPDDQQVDALRDVVAVFKFTTNPTFRALLLQLGGLTKTEKEALADSAASATLLHMLAGMTEAERQKLAGAHLADDPARRHAVTTAASLSPPMIGALEGMADLGEKEGQKLVYVLDLIKSGDPAFSSLLDALWLKDPDLMGVVVRSFPKKMRHTTLPSISP